MHAQARRGCTSVLQGMMIIFAQRLVMPLVSGCGPRTESSILKQAGLRKERP
jgi:hypothetical protein